MSPVHRRDRAALVLLRMTLGLLMTECGVTLLRAGYRAGDFAERLNQGLAQNPLGLAVIERFHVLADHAEARRSGHHRCPSSGRHLAADRGAHAQRIAVDRADLFGSSDARSATRNGADRRHLLGAGAERRWQKPNASSARCADQTQPPVHNHRLIPIDPPLSGVDQTIKILLG